MEAGSESSEHLASIHCGEGLCKALEGQTKGEMSLFGEGMDGKTQRLRGVKAML